MKNYITIDGGTTTTRVSLVCDKAVRQTVKLNVGARKSMDGGADYRGEIKRAIETVMSDNGLVSSDITRILASGMITSEFGLCNLPHITVPAGMAELHDNMHEIILADISDIPFVFVRGVKSVSENISETDMMRGEETELCGLMSEDDGECMYILPGSHSKLILTDDKGRISRFSTMLTGEMIYALSQSTILKDAVDLSISETDEVYLLMGDEYCREHGINEALFKTRILKNLFGATAVQCYSFFLGVVLSNELSAIRKSDIKKVMIGGKAQIKAAMAKILAETSDKEIVCADEGLVDASTAMGLVKIYEYR